MCCEDLVCASCAQPVAEGRCPVCRAARARMHAVRGTSAATIAMIVLLLALAALLSTRLTG